MHKVLKASSILARWIVVVYDLVMRGLRYVLGGHLIMAIGEKVAVVGARIAVTVLFFSSLWVAGESTVHPFMVSLLRHIPIFTITTGQLDAVALSAFTWLPEIIVLEALLKTIFFWIDVFKKERRAWSAIWGTIYLPLTCIFIGIAISTFMTYISDAASTHTDKHALLVRALMAWIYSVIEMAQPAIHRKMYGSEPVAGATVKPVQVNQLQELVQSLHQLNQDTLNQFQQTMLNQLNQFQQSLAPLNQLVQMSNSLRATQVHLVDLADLTKSLHHSQEETLDRLVASLDERQSQHLEAVFSRFEQVHVREERPAPRQFTSTRLRAIAPAKPVQEQGEPDEPVQPEDPATELLNQVTDGSATEQGARVLNYLNQCVAQGVTPSLTDISETCLVSRKTAIDWRRVWNERRQPQLAIS